MGRRLSVNFLKCVGDFFGLGLVDEDPIAPIMLQRRSQIPSFCAMGIPGESLAQFFMNDNFGARRGHGSFIEIKHTFQDVVGRDVRMMAGCADKV